MAKNILKILLLVQILFICTSCDSGETNIPIKEVKTSIPSNSENSNDGIDKVESITPSNTVISDQSKKSYSVILIGIEDQPYSSITESIYRGLIDGIGFLLNQEDGLGIEITLVKLNVDNPSKIGETLIVGMEDHDPLAIFMAAPVTQQLYDLINNYDVPVLYFGTGNASIEVNNQVKDHMFWLIPTPAEQMAFYYHSLWGNWASFRPPGMINEFRIGYLSSEGMPGESDVPALIEDYIEQNNYELVLKGNVVLSPNASAANFLLDAILTNATVLYTDLISFGSLVLLNDIWSLGLYDFFAVGGSIWSYDSSMVLGLLSQEQVETFYIPLPTTWWTEEDNPAIVQAKKIHELAGRSESDRNLAYLLALGAVDVFKFSVSEILEISTKEDISAKDIYLTLSSVKDYSVLNGLFEIDYSMGDRTPNVLRLWEISNGNQFSPAGERGLVPDLSTTDDQD